MIQKSNIGVGAPSQNAHFGRLPLFPDISPLHLGPVEWFGASQGAIIAYPIGTFSARIWVSCGYPKGRYLLYSPVLFSPALKVFH